jgi:hypothetical protein
VTRDRIVTLILFCSCLLLVLNCVGLLVSPARHPLAGEKIEHKQGLRLVSAEQVRVELDALVPAATAAFLRRATAIIAGGVRHHWPDENQFDSNVALQIQENWVAALAGWVERPLVGVGLLGKYRFARLERVDHEDILNKGVGLCSQVSLALASYLTSVGIPARLVGLDGHVVVAARAGQQPYLLDADYNVAIAASLSEAEASTVLVAQAYASAGYPPKLANELAVIFGPAGNYVGGPASYHPRHGVIYGALAALKWGVPLVMLLLAVIARRRQRRFVTRVDSV